MPILTVFTTTYNRAYLLHQCYESLCRQTNKDFIWLIIDDGSTDNTKDIVNEWILNNNGFEIRYVYKQNGGMHTGHNKAYELIDTELNVCIDSDDFMTDNAVEIIIDFWEKNKSDKYAGIITLDILKNGKVVGDELPKQKSITVSGYYDNGGKGDKKLIYRTEVVKKYPKYPEYDGEKLVPLSYKYLLIDQDYELLILNKPTCIVEYMDDGSTKNIYKQYYKNPKGFSFFRKVHMKYDKKLKSKFKTCVHYVAMNIILKNQHFIKESPKKFMTALSIPFGIILYLLIKMKNREGDR